jgi:hypothetical protein
LAVVVGWGFVIDYLAVDYLAGRLRHHGTEFAFLATSAGAQQSNGNPDAILTHVAHCYYSNLLRYKQQLEHGEGGRPEETAASHEHGGAAATRQHVGGAGGGGAPRAAVAASTVHEQQQQQQQQQHAVAARARSSAVAASPASSASPAESPRSQPRQAPPARRRAGTPRSVFASGKGRAARARATEMATRPQLPLPSPVAGSEEMTGW